MSTVATGERLAADRPTPTAARKPRGMRALMHGFLILMSLVWLFPVLYAVMNSLRSYQYTQENGYLSFGGWTFDNYTTAWERAGFTGKFVNTLYVTVPGVLLTLFLSACMAFVLARFSFKFNLTLLGIFLAANLLPQQALLIPLYRMFREIPLPEWMNADGGTMLNSYWALILVNTAFQTGFCTFVLSNYMKTLPKELYESAMVDGASVLRQFFQLTLPLCRPPLAALATLEVTWIYNEFFWATVLLQSGDKFPITSSLNNLRGQFFTDVNLVAAGSVVVALPPLIIFFILQRQFVSGLTLGATKG